MTIAALEDLAELRLEASDADGADALLTEAAELLPADLVFGWRLEFRHRLLTARLALLRGEAERAKTVAGELASVATVLGVPRYASVARLTTHLADRQLDLPADLSGVEADLDLLDRSAAIEAWRWTGEMGAAFGQAGWLERAHDRAGQLAANAGDYADQLRRAAGARLAGWQQARHCG